MSGTTPYEGASTGCQQTEPGPASRVRRAVTLSRQFSVAEQIGDDVGVEEHGDEHGHPSREL